jgi:hypothetical protein
MNVTLHAILIRCRDLSSSSQDAMYSPTTVAEIVDVLTRGIELLERGSEPNRDELKLLFAPTGALQETSMDNGWVREYLTLSEAFDGLIA